MYRALTKWIARNAVGDLSNRNLDLLLHRWAVDVRHTFAGAHALSGTRHSRAAFWSWCGRPFRLFPELTRTVRDVTATGLPWNTRLAIARRDRGMAAEGVDQENKGVYLFRLEWGRLVVLESQLDTQHLERTLDWMAAAGIAEATADPIGHS